jgi:hypothetical protein
MGLGSPGSYQSFQDPLGGTHSSVWNSGNDSLPCFDVSCRSPNDTPVGPSYWYGTPYGNDFAQFAGPFFDLGSWLSKHLPNIHCELVRPTIDPADGGIQLLFVRCTWN